MKAVVLRRVRIFLSVVFFIPITLLFLDFTGLIPSNIFNVITYLQFFPSLLKVMHVLSFAAAGFVVVLILTLLFGRIYCSSICPLGIFQDIVSRISKKFFKRKKFKYLKNLKWLRYSLLAVSIISLIFGSVLALNLLDPYSSFGKITANLFRPVLILINNLAALISLKFDWYFFYSVELKAFNPAPFLISLGIFGLVVYLSFTNGRLYCNTVCPVGTLLGILSKYSFFRFEIDRDECLECGDCEIKCKAGCIDSENKTIEMDRCVVCFNCLDACPTEVINFKSRFGDRKRKNLEEVKVNLSKRDFIVSSIGYMLSFALPAFAQKKIVVNKPNTVAILRKNAVSPPGSVSLEHFTGNCTACNLCVSACPTQVLQPSFLEYGFLGIMQPHLDNKSGFCNYDCKICSDVCPTGAILSISLEEKKLTQLGKAKFVKDNCVVYTQKTECGACAEHCPTKAVHMIKDGELTAPEVRDEYCIGCGACEYACPTFPYKSIYVEGNEVHQKAKKPKEEKPQQKIDYKEDFPF